MISTITQAQRIVRARMDVILAAPFFGSLLMRLPMVPDAGVPTFCTNGQVIRYNDTFAASLSDAELRGVLVHEVCHCAQGHLWRQGDRDGRKWNVATDYAINNLLEAYVAEEKQSFEQKHGSGRFIAPWTLPAGGLIDPAFANLSSEEIYARLPNENSDEGKSAADASPSAAGTGRPSGSPANGNEPSSCGEFEAPSAADPSAASTEQDWKIAVTQATTVAKMRGELSSSLQRLLGELLAPKVPWRQVLREFIRQFARDDYSFRRPSRRYSGHGIILPSLHSERMGRLAIAVDTSGSIDAEILAAFQAETQAALDECQPEAIEMIYCDAAVHGTEEYLPGDTVRLTPKGGGGTNFTPVFTHLERAEPPVACIYLTDGWGEFPRVEPAYPVLWASTDRDQFPFGQVVAVR